MPQEPPRNRLARATEHPFAESTLAAGVHLACHTGAHEGRLEAFLERSGEPCLLARAVLDCIQDVRKRHDVALRLRRWWLTRTKMEQNPKKST
jgi:hypothetical protein